MYAAAAANSLQSCPTLCDPIDGSPPGSPVPRILQARTLEWVAISFANAWKWKVKVNSLSRVQLSDPMDCSPPGSSIHGLFQARVLEWGAIAFSKHKLRPYQWLTLIVELKVIMRNNPLPNGEIGQILWCVINGLIARECWNLEWEIQFLLRKWFEEEVTFNLGFEG